MAKSTFGDANTYKLMLALYRRIAGPITRQIGVYKPSAEFLEAVKKELERFEKELKNERQ